MAVGVVEADVFVIELVSNLSLRNMQLFIVLLLVIQCLCETL